MIVDVLAEDVRNGSLMEFLYADDIVLCGESLNDVMGKYGKCKNAEERKGLRVNVDKIKVGSCYLGRKIVFRKWIFLVSVVNGLVVILFSVRIVRGCSWLFCCA